MTVALGQPRAAQKLALVKMQPDIVHAAEQRPPKGLSVHHAWNIWGPAEGPGEGLGRRAETARNPPCKAVSCHFGGPQGNPKPRIEGVKLAWPGPPRVLEKAASVRSRSCRAGQGGDCWRCEAANGVPGSCKRGLTPVSLCWPRPTREGQLMLLRSRPSLWDRRVWRAAWLGGETACRERMGFGKTRCVNKQHLGGSMRLDRPTGSKIVIDLGLVRPCGS